LTAAYERAGLGSGEIQGVAALVAAVEAGDPLASWVAVRRTDVLQVVGALNRLVDRYPASEGVSIPWIFVRHVIRGLPTALVVPDLETIVRILGARQSALSFGRGLADG
jgi:hypothetical protein